MTTPLAPLGEVGTNGHGVVKPCAGCGAAFRFAGKGSARVRYCPECRAKKCSSCNGAGGQHYPYCSWVKPRPCRSCGVELGHGGSHKWFCEPCWAQQCPECKVRAGRHQKVCRYLERRRRPPLTTIYGVVSADDVVALFNECHAKAVSLAQYVGRLNHADAEDVVGDVFLSIWKNRDYLKTPPGRAYLFTAVTHGALRKHLYAWSRYVVTMDPEDLVLAEQAMYDPTQPAAAVPG